MPPTRRSFAARCLCAVLAIACARAATPSDLDGQSFASPQAAALAHLARDLAPGAPMRVEWNTSPLAASDSGAEAWVTRWSGMLRGVPRPLLAAYVAANREAARGTLPSVVGAHRVVVIAADSPGDARAERYTLTVPGLSARGDSAFLFVSRTCGPLCGRTDALLVVRDERGWRVTSRPFSASH